MQENHFGKKSQINITAACSKNQTILKDVSFTAPFKVMKPFYDDGDIMKLMLISVSAGIMSGDTQEINIEVQNNAKLEVNSQSYEKIHKMDEGHAARNTKLTVSDGGYLYYNPLPVIPFAGSEFISSTQAELESEKAVLEYKEILSCGRAACGERFQYHLYQNKLSVFLRKELIYYDNCCLEPSRMEMEGYGLFEGYSHMGTYLIYNREMNKAYLTRIKDTIAAIKENIPENTAEAGATLTEYGIIVVKLLGNSAQELEDYIEMIREKISVPYEGTGRR